MTYLNKKSRFDSIIIWGHGLQYLDEILNMIRQEDCFEIKRIIKHRPSSMKSFVKKVYSYDYAPLAHLKSKIKYLESIEPCLVCIVIKNLNPQVEILGEGSFRHEESLSLKKLKSRIRDKYNPYLNGHMTHDHVIHATDNEEQTYHILNAIGDVNIKNYYHLNLYSTPFFLGKQSEYQIKEVGFEHLVCGQAQGPSDNFHIHHVPIKESVQYLALGDGGKKYNEYVNTYLGTAIKCDYSVDNFLSLAENFIYLSNNYETSYVIVRKFEGDNYLIVDGLHRASLHLSQGNTKIKVCVIK